MPVSPLALLYAYFFFAIAAPADMLIITPLFAAAYFAAFSC